MNVGIWWIILKERDNLKDLGVFGKKLLKTDVTQVDWEGVGRIYLGQDKEDTRSLANTVINLRVPYKAGNFLTS
jgi:hypothetical protein